MKKQPENKQVPPKDTETKGGGLVSQDAKPDERGVDVHPEPEKEG